MVLFTMAFMGLVNCLDQLGLRVPCVQETQSPLMRSLPVDQLFWYDGSVRNHGREVSYSASLVASPNPKTLTHNPVAGVSSQALFCGFQNPTQKRALSPSAPQAPGSNIVDATVLATAQANMEPHLKGHACSARLRIK